MGNKDEVKLAMLIPVLALWPALMMDDILVNIDPSFKQDGFCYARAENQGFDSFEVCFYIDTAFAILLYYFSQKFPDQSDLFMKQIIPIFMHGAAHYMIYTVVNQIAARYFIFSI